ncbi:MAG TPA: WD40 repeat domain-containing protein, partial [Cytophagaceae bacterium]
MIRVFFITLLTITAYLTKAQNYKIETILQKGHIAAVKAIAIDDAGKFLASGSRDKTAKIWDLTTGREIRTFIGHEHTVNGIQFSKDSKKLLTSSADGTARVWDVFTGKQLFVSKADNKLLTDVSFSPDGNYVLTAGYSDHLKIWDIARDSIIKTIEVNADQGSGYGISIQYSKDGKYLIIGEDNRTAKVYDANTYQLVYTLKPEEGWCGGCGTYTDISKDGKSLFTQSNNSLLAKYDLSNGSLVKTWGEKFDGITGIQLSNDEKVLLAGDEQYAYLFDPLSLDLIKKIPVPEGTKATQVLLGKDSISLFIAMDDNSIHQYNYQSGQLIKIFSGLVNEDAGRNLGYDPNNYWQSSISKYLRLKNNLLLMNDGKKMIKGKTGPVVKMWDIATGNPEQLLTGHESGVVDLATTKDNKLLATADVAGLIKIWDVKNNKQLVPLKGHGYPVFKVQFSP